MKNVYMNIWYCRYDVMLDIQKNAHGWFSGCWKHRHAFQYWCFTKNRRRKEARFQTCGRFAMIHIDGWVGKVVVLMWFVLWGIYTITLNIAITYIIHTSDTLAGICICLALLFCCFQSSAMFLSHKLTLRFKFKRKCRAYYVYYHAQGCKQEHGSLLLLQSDTFIPC